MPFARRVMVSLVLAVTGLSCASSPGSGPLEGAASGGRPELKEASSGTVIQLPGDQPSRGIEVAASPEKAWSALPLVYQELGIAGKVLDPGSRTFGLRRFRTGQIGGRRTDEYVRCASQSMGPSAVAGYRLELSVVSRVESSPGGQAAVSTHVTGSASAIDGTSTAPVRCVSTGGLEERIARMLSDRAVN